MASSSLRRNRDAPLAERFAPPPPPVRPVAPKPQPPGTRVVVFVDAPFRENGKELLQQLRAFENVRTSTVHDGRGNWKMEWMQRRLEQHEGRLRRLHAKLALLPGVDVFRTYRTDGRWDLDRWEADLAAVAPATPAAAPARAPARAAADADADADEDEDADEDADEEAPPRTAPRTARRARRPRAAGEILMLLRMQLDPLGVDESAYTLDDGRWDLARLRDDVVDLARERAFEPDREDSSVEEHIGQAIVALAPAGQVHAEEDYRSDGEWDLEGLVSDLDFYAEERIEAEG